MADPPKRTWISLRKTSSPERDGDPPPKCEPVSEALLDAEEISEPVQESEPKIAQEQNLEVEQKPEGLEGFDFTEIPADLESPVEEVEETEEAEEDKEAVVVTEPEIPEEPEAEEEEWEKEPPEAPAPVITMEESATEPPKVVIIAHPVASTARLIRETLEQFTGARVHVTADPLHAFELALQHRSTLFFFAMRIGELSGPMLYELISKTYTSGYGPRRFAPAVIFVREKDDPRPPESLIRDVRVKDVLGKPIWIERILEAVDGVLEVHDPTIPQ